METTTLALYLATAILSQRPHTDPGLAQDVAEDVAAVVAEEEPAFANDDDRSRTGVLMVSIARFESEYAKWVDDGRCNDAAWRQSADGKREMRKGDCDHGHAYSLWQVHPYAGHDAADLTDRRKAISAALELARRSLRMGAGLCRYTGEPLDNCPKGTARLEAAKDWSRKHPFEAAPQALVRE